MAGRKRAHGPSSVTDARLEALGLRKERIPGIPESGSAESIRLADDLVRAAITQARADDGERFRFTEESDPFGIYAALDIETRGPGGIKEFDALLQSQVNVEHDGDQVTITIQNTKLGPVSFTFGESDARSMLAVHWAMDVYGEGSELFEEASEKVLAALLADSMTALFVRLPQAVRNLASDVWSHAIKSTRATRAGIPWRMERLEDVTNEERPFWDDPKPGNQPLPSRTRNRIQAEHRRLKYDRGRRKGKQEETLIVELQRVLSESGINLGLERIKDVVHRGR